jgi:NAD(P)-dependent dehydrogenase (short-subunit alcohol dehydrogenase family)
MLLTGKTAILFGAGGATGGAVAKAFAREGARLFVSGRSLSRVEALARPLDWLLEVARDVDDEMDESGGLIHLDSDLPRGSKRENAELCPGLLGPPVQGGKKVRLARIG